jgi:hypothetical protein
MKGKGMRVMLAALLIVAMLALSATPVLAQEWVKFPATWAFCEYDSYGTYWCFLENDQVWIRVNPNWMYGPAGG